jgi:Ser/Thr protein kinase RdoA (MazF antagonist)
MSQSVWGDQDTQFFYSISADDILSAVDSVGLRTTGRVLQLNSYENRVYEAEIELEGESLNPSEYFKIIKFYRPGRWSEQQILDEHQFLKDLDRADIPVIAPLSFNNKTLFSYNGIFYALFPKQGGRNLYDLDEELAKQLGRLIGRMHLIGSEKEASHRLKLNPENFIDANLNFLIKSGKIPNTHQDVYHQTVLSCKNLILPLFEGVKYQRIHGDCHRGNIIISRNGPTLIDFDDMYMGPAIQDIWLIFPGNDPFTLQMREAFIDGYETFLEFPYHQFKLVEALRTMRLIHFSAWIGKRFDDPAFKNTFTTYGLPEYWSTEIRYLQEQIDLLERIVS